MCVVCYFLFWLSVVTILNNVISTASVVSNCMYHIFISVQCLFVSHSSPKQLRHSPIHILDVNPWLFVPFAVATPIAHGGTNRIQPVITHPHNKGVWITPVHHNPTLTNLPLCLCNNALRPFFSSTLPHHSSLLPSNLQLHTPTTLHNKSKAVAHTPERPLCLLLRG